MYGAEPHPVVPGTNFDDGTQRPQSWSSIHQQRSYQDRVNNAKRIADQVHPDQVSGHILEARILCTRQLCY